MVNRHKGIKRLESALRIVILVVLGAMLVMAAACQSIAGTADSDAYSLSSDTSSTQSQKPRDLSGPAAPNAAFYSSNGLGDFTPQKVTQPGAAAGEADVTVDLTRSMQTIEGFGGAFNEKGWEALGALSPSDKDAVLKSLFTPEGLALLVCRVPIGASDYAVDRYTLDETPGDFDLKNFSISRDRQRLIPYVRAAMTLQPKLRLWASAWTPPSWMKDNKSFDGGNMLDDAKVYASYAEYLAKFMQAYRSEGLPMELVAVQNEPRIETHYPSALWTPEQYGTFVRDYMAPAFARYGFNKSILLGTYNQFDNYKHALAVLTDNKTRDQIGAIGLQWDGIDIIPRLSAFSQGIRYWQTETDCGNWYWRPGFDPDKPQNDFTYGSYTWGKMRDYLRAGVTVYDMWNMVLDQTGKSIDSKLPWPQNSAIVIDTDRKTVTYTPMYYAFASFSRFVTPGSTLQQLRGANGDAVAFHRPDGKMVVVVRNPNIDTAALVVDVGGKPYGFSVPGKSFGTLVVDGNVDKT